MRSIERRFKIEQDKTPHYSTFVNFSHAVEYQRFNRETITKWFSQLVDTEDYDRRDKNDLIEHLLRSSHSSKQSVDTVNRG